ncbi:CheR family methyltransferase, partial [Aphanothece stagnina]|uniref:CheR family methyltransferase n=1 Tax=Aphanothece stagnina TaxID=1004305 RepID=UPI00398E5248
MIHALPGTLPTPHLGRAEANLICRMVRQHGGIAIAPGKTAFLQLRVARRLRALGLDDFARYSSLLTGPAGQTELPLLVEALTTHTTGFFRESAQYDWLQTTGLPALIARGAGRERRLLLWSAACSTGAEMWTAAMVVDRLARGMQGGLRWGVAGSDVSRAILSRAARAIFQEDEIAGLPEEWRRDYLLRSRLCHGRTRLYRIAPDLRRLARLHWANLTVAPPALESDADVAFLRNVLIYFDD